MKDILCTIFLAITLFCSAAIAMADSQPPAWMKQAAAVTVPTYKKDVSAVVLFEEQQVTLGSDGKLVTVENYVVKVLNREGRDQAIARAFYLVSAGKIREIQAWLIRADGSIKAYDKSSILDIIADPDDVYNEGRIKVIDGSGEADTNHVFGYTVVSEDVPLFYQDNWSFQGVLPTLLSRYTLNLPAGWTASSTTFNAAQVKPTVTGSSYTWEMRDLPAIPSEPLSPSVQNLAPRIAVNYSPADPSLSKMRAFADWADVSRWATSLYDPQVVVTDEIAIKARELTANSKTEFDKIHAIGAYVQNLQYISIDIGVGYGNGYKPRPSDIVLSRGYGDCKDKANLMRAMLRTLKIDAYPIAIYSGDHTFVRAEWASPRQFNHAIIAVKVSDATESATVIDHPKLGRLLIFDATDAFTPVGDLPDYLQGSNALIIAGDNGGLSKMPLVPPDLDVLERDVTVTLSETGTLNGLIKEKAAGQTSAYFRREFRGLSVGDYRKAIEGWLTRGASGAQLVNLTASDKHSDARFYLDMEFAAKNYGQLMQNRLLVFKPLIVGRRNGVSLTEPTRTNPIEIDSASMRETITYTLPTGFAVDEVPAAVLLETDFGKYSTTFDVTGDKLVVKRLLTMNRRTIAADKYAGVKDFFAKIHQAEQAPVVLIRK
ncbi:MAG: DUF3857 domain-containing protein [Pyrinomonadaceae bacterium]